MRLSVNTEIKKSDNDLFLIYSGLLFAFQKLSLGETWQQKIWEYDGSNGLDSVRSKLVEADAGGLVVSKLDEIACKWV